MCSTSYLDVQTDTWVLICCYTLYTVCHFISIVVTVTVLLIFVV